MCEIEPLLQGELDEYCGQYALINAIRWLKPSLGDEELRALFAESLARVSEFRRGKRSARVTYGLSGEELEALMNMFLSEYNIGFRALVDDATVSAWTIFNYWRAISNFFERAGARGVVIIRLRGMSNHWTVVSGINNEVMTLFDSRYLDEVERSECCISEEDREHYYQLSVYETYLVYTRD